MGDYGGRRERKGRKDEVITLAGSCSWMPAKIKKGGKKRKKIGGDKDPLLTFKRCKSKRAQRETHRQQRTTAMGEDRKGWGGSWHILQLLFLTAIRTCQSLSTCHSSVLIGGLSLQIAQIKIPHSWGTSLDPPTTPTFATCLPTQSPTLLKERGEERDRARNAGKGERC